MALVELEGIHKHFGVVHALRGASLNVEAGEIHALVGENGSGKTTLMRILCADLACDAGEIRVDGRKAHWASPAEARLAGIGVVYQEPNLAPDMTVAENVFMGALPTRLHRVDWRALTRRCAALVDETGIPLQPRRYVRELSPDQRQLVEIAKIVAARPRVIALDEPTASLTEDQVEILFDLLGRLRNAGSAVILITHRLREVFRLCDRTTVLRDGESRAELAVAETDTDEIIRLMVGRELGSVHRNTHRPGAAALEVRGLSRGTVLHDVSLEVAQGEIVGIAGLVGAGRSALVRTLFGLRHPEAGEILVDGKALRCRSPRDAIAAGLGIVPEDRRLSGLCLDMSVAENIALSLYGKRPLASRVSVRTLNAQAHHFVSELSIRTRGADAKAKTLSGGNQQKVVIARWLAREPRVLILDEPTRGIDVGAKAEIYTLLDELAGRGVAVLVSSSELPELLTLCDRIYAMYRGSLVAEFTRAEATEEAVARAISGVTVAA